MLTRWFRDLNNDWTPSLGNCIIKGRPTSYHTYKGDTVVMNVPKMSYKYSRRAESSDTYDYGKIMGGFSVSFFGLAGASAQATVTTTVTKNSKSLLMFGNLRVHKDVLSLANVRLGDKWKTCTTRDKHYYVRDILTGMENYIIVNLFFSTKAKREEIEVKIKIKVLFFTISKTIRKIKTDLQTNVRIEVRSLATFPIHKESKRSFTSVDAALTYIDNLEKEANQSKQLLKTTRFDDKRLYLRYYFMPCLIRTVNDALPFTPARNNILYELLNRVTEVRSVLTDLRSVMAGNKKFTSTQTTELNNLLNDINQRLGKIPKSWENVRNAGNVVQILRLFYGPNRAPFYYERALKRITNDW